jgi:hypothetical protein
MIKNVSETWCLTLREEQQVDCGKQGANANTWPEG